MGTSSAKSLSKSLEEYSRITADLYDKGSIDKHEMTEASKKIQHYYQTLRSGIQAYRDRIEKGIIDIDSVTTIKQETGWEIFIPEGCYINPDEALPVQKAPLMRLSGLKEWQPRQKTLVDDLAAFLNGFKEMAQAKSHVSAVLEIQTLVQKLMLHEIALTKEQSAEVISQLHTLGFLYYEIFKEAVFKVRTRTANSSHLKCY